MITCVGGPAHGQKIDSIADVVYLPQVNVEYVRRKLSMENSSVDILVPKGQIDRITLQWLLNNKRWKP